MSKQTFDDFCQSIDPELKEAFRKHCLTRLTHDEMKRPIHLIVWNRLYQSFQGWFIKEQA